MQCMLLRSRQDIRQNTFLYPALQDDAELLLASRNKDVILNTSSEILGSSLTNVPGVPSAAFQHDVQIDYTPAMFVRHISSDSAAYLHHSPP